jgi:uncharacterized membrane protein
VKGSVLSFLFPLRRLLRCFDNLNEDIRLLGLLLCWLQVFDGLLTAIGMAKYGIEFEGNPLLRYLMYNYGYVNALFFTKLTSIIIIMFICMFASKSTWVKPSLIAVNSIYVFAALIPWIITLSDSLSAFS